MFKNSTCKIAPYDFEHMNGLALDELSCILCTNRQLVEGVNIPYVFLSLLRRTSKMNMGWWQLNKLNIFFTCSLGGKCLMSCGFFSIAFGFEIF
jgi:hypothetical protein